VSYSLNEDVKEYLYREFPYFLSFAQRRRIIISGISLVPGSGVISLPIQAAAELLDAVAFGSPAIDPNQLGSLVATFVVWRESATSFERREL
jgi:hypothetical protein